jgi:hypothetical protein
MGSTLAYANPLSCAPAHGGRAGHPEDRSPVHVRLDRTPLPASPRHCAGAVNHGHGRPPARHRPARARRHSGLSPTRPRGVAAALVATAHPGDHLRCWGRRVPPGPMAPESADVRHAHAAVATRAGRRGPFCPGVHAAMGQRRRAASGPPPGGGGLAACHALAHQSRSGRSPPQHRRDHLIQWALPQSTWALGVGDDVWWSRLAPPDHHGGTDTAVTHHLPAVLADDRGASRDRPRAQQTPLAASQCAYMGAWPAGRLGSGPAAACGRTRSTC